MKKSTRIALTIIFLLSLLGITPFQHVQAATVWVVTNTNDNGTGSLRQAAMDASNGDTIKFHSSLAGKTIHFASELQIDKSITIDGSNLNPRITLSGDTDNNGTSDVQIMTITTNGNVRILGLDFTNGKKGISFTGGIANFGLLEISACKFSGNTGDMGGALLNRGNLTIQDCEFIDNYAHDGGAIFNDIGSTATISDTLFVQNTADTMYGGGGAIGNIGNLLVTYSEFSENIAANGGAVVNARDGNTTISQTTFTANAATTESGGAIFNINGTMTISASFNGNTATKNGGAIFIENGTVNVENSYFSENTASLDGGGAIFNNLNSTATIFDSAFNKNNASGTFGGGGAIANVGSLTVSRSDFTHNTSVDGGGAILAGGDTTIYNTNFSSNTTGLGGGGAILSWINITIENSSFSSNIATGYGASGGAINHPSDGNITISQSTFSNNTANGGGAISLGRQNYPYPATSPTLSISNTVISNNHADFGGGLLILAGTTTVNNTTISENSSEDVGGIVNSAFGNLTIINSTVDNNSVINTNSPAGILTEGPISIINSTIANNLGSAIQSYGETNIINSTIAGNIAYGIRHYSGVLVLKNSILANNWWDCTLEIGGSIGESQNNVIEENFCGIANLDSDPKLGPLANNGGATQTMALLRGSPAIDAGDDSVCPTTDQRGITRPKGSHCDIGAYEFENKPDLIITNVTINPVTPGVNQTFEVNITVKNQGGETGSNIVYRDVYIDRDPSTLINPTTGCPPPGDFFRADYFTNLPEGWVDTKTITITGGLPKGSYQLWVYVDSRCLIDEGGGSNNTP
ncbi:MAG: hypothetical protein IH588_08405 [Anaerolineales bacterium]|nr:hypothetical protein [Anaerolineales bacterium]